jgi:hypothetical protein
MDTLVTFLELINSKAERNPRFLRSFASSVSA